MLLKDKITIVTGASRGIGKAISQRFSKEGTRVFALSRNITGNSCHNNIWKLCFPRKKARDYYQHNCLSF